MPVLHFWVRSSSSGPLWKFKMELYRHFSPQSLKGRGHCVGFSFYKFNKPWLYGNSVHGGFFCLILGWERKGNTNRSVWESKGVKSALLFCYVCYFAVNKPLLDGDNIQHQPALSLTGCAFSTAGVAWWHFSLLYSLRSLLRNVLIFFFFSKGTARWGHWRSQGDAPKTQNLKVKVNFRNSLVLSVKKWPPDVLWFLILYSCMNW